jgi:hypothetical protein
MLTEEEVERVTHMKWKELVANANSVDLGVLVETNLRLDRTTKILNGILIWLNVILVAMTVAIVMAEWPHIKEFFDRFK